jgi:hypothetical protein
MPLWRQGRHGLTLRALGIQTSMAYRKAQWGLIVLQRPAYMDLMIDETD